VDGGQAAELTWHSGRPCDSGACVEAAATGEAVLVRSTSDPDGGRLTLSPQEWAAFVASVKEGLFDSL
jgi:hypothetical protein